MCCKTQCSIVAISITIVMLSMVIPMAFIGVLAGPKYVIYVAWPGPVISSTLMALILRKLKAKYRTNPTAPRSQLPLPATTTQLKRAPKEQKTEQDRLIQLSIPRHVPGYSAVRKVTFMGNLNVKKATASVMHQEPDEENEKSPMNNVVQDIRWWNKEFSACVVK